MSITFTKLVGTGNDFILIDRRRKGTISRAGGGRLAQKLCDRQRSVGADGILVLEPSRKADFRMRIFNPDGSEAEMCGNGSRCAAFYAVGRKTGHVSFETLAGLLEAKVRGQWVKVWLPDPHSFRRNLTMALEGRRCILHSINTSVPHAVFFVTDPERIDVDRLGRIVRNHRMFQPRGTNVDFVKILGPGRIEIRTYERGVEGETLSCGTGSVASALVAASLKGFRSPITVLTKGKERLRIFFEGSLGNFTNVCLEGKVTPIFEGRISDV